MLKLSLTKWKLCGFYPYVPVKGTSMELGTDLKGVTSWMDADVPGSVYESLIKAGYIEHPYYEQNSLKCEWVKDRWWVYQTQFTIDKEPTGRLKVLFEGICYQAEIYLNGKKIATSENYFVPVEVDITDAYQKGSNTLKVVLRHQPDEYGQIGYTSETFTQKPRFDYKWDFSLRMVAVGLVKSVTVFETPSARITEYFFNRDSRTDGRFTVEMTIDAHEATTCEIQCALNFGGKDVFTGGCVKTLKKGGNTAKIEGFVEDVKLWYPNGEGEQNQYQLTLTLWCGGLSHTAGQKVGFKNLSIQPNDGAEKDALGYTFWVNGKRIYIKGVNIVPIDNMLGSETQEQYRGLIDKMKKSNVNLIRVWGGGVIESQEFYRLCSEAGILVWQDFIQSSSGICNYPSHKKEFLTNFARTVEWAVKARRNYAALAVFCGGNELMDEHWRPVDFECENIAVAKKIVDQFSSVWMYPSTPSGLRFSPSQNQWEKNHDVHGEWTYQGEKNHYAHYNAMKCLLHSEFGCDGMVERESAERFMAREHLGFINMDENDLWRHRGEWWNSYYREKKIFGGNIKDYDDFYMCSQFMQYEGLRYILECNRRNAFYNSGSIIWQANEPCPNVSCTSLLDYYQKEKLALKAVKNIFEKVVPSLKYDSLTLERGEKGKAELYLISELVGENTQLCIKAYGGKKLLLQREYCVAPDQSSTLLDTLEIEAGDFDSVRWEMTAKVGDKMYRNDVLWLVRGKDGCKIEDVKEFYKKLQSC